jgi:hypothetical protein
MHAADVAAVEPPAMEAGQAAAMKAATPAVETTAPAMKAAAATVETTATTTTES